MLLIHWAVAWEQQITAYKEYLISAAHKSIILLLHGIPDLFLLNYFLLYSLFKKSFTNWFKCLHGVLILYSHSCTSNWKWHSYVRGQADLFLCKIAKGQHERIHLTFPLFSVRPSLLLLLLQLHKSTIGILLKWTHFNLFKKTTSPEPILSAYFSFHLPFLVLHLYNCFLICLVFK